jgi:hypothetical protein
VLLCRKFGSGSKSTDEEQDSAKQSAALYTITDGICKDCTVLKGKAGIRVEGEDGTTGSKKVYIHHILTNELTKPSTAFLSGCSATTATPNTEYMSFGGSKFIGTGDDQASIYTYYTPQDVRLDTGYYVQPSFSFRMNAVLVNEEAAGRDVFVTMELEYLKGKVGGDTRDVLFMGGPCDKPMLVNTSKKEATITESGNYFFREDGTIIYAKGHLHAGTMFPSLYCLRAVIDIWKVVKKWRCTSTGSSSANLKQHMTTAPKE